MVEYADNKVDVVRFAEAVLLVVVLGVVVNDLVHGYIGDDGADARGNGKCGDLFNTIEPRTTSSAMSR